MYNLHGIYINITVVFEYARSNEHVLYMMAELVVALKILQGLMS
jgi:hypothetical protein